MKISSSQCNDHNYSKKGKKTIDISKKRKKIPAANSKIDTSLLQIASLLNSSVKCYCGVAANDAGSAEKIKICKTHEINANPEKYMSTHDPKKEVTFLLTEVLKSVSNLNTLFMGEYFTAIFFHTIYEREI